jgi:hypothetical protein
MRDGGFGVVVEMFGRDHDKHADASGETKGFWYRLDQQVSNLWQDAPIL